MCEQFRKCVKCGVLSAMEPSLSFHRFPRIGKKQPDALLISRMWAEFSYPNDNYNDAKFLKKLYTSHKMLCSRHFAADSFVSENKLNKFSVPIGMQHILEKAINEARSSYQFSVPTNISQQTGGLELLSTCDMSEDNSILKQVPESGKHNSDKPKCQAISPREKLKISRRSLNKMSVLKHKLEQQKNLKQIQNMVHNDDFSLPTNISTQTEVLKLLSSSDMSEDNSIPKQVPEDLAHNAGSRRAVLDGRDVTFQHSTRSVHSHSSVHDVSKQVSKMSSTVNTRKSCVVPKCTNTTTNAPEKLFFLVPMDVKIRKHWLKAMRRVDAFGDKSKVYCCEDHFDVENDMENYIKYKIVGGRIKLKNGAVPHNFKCQQEKKDKPTRSAEHKRKKIYVEIQNLNNQKLQERSSKEKFVKICRKRLQKICVLKQKWKYLKQIKNLVHNDDVRKLFEYKISDDLVLLLQSQTKYYTKKPRRRHYTLEEQVLALPLYKKSPAMYRLLRRFFSLPCQKSLKKLVKNVPLNPGINRQIFAGLADMVQINENVCTLMFKEMSIKKSEDVKIKALVFMLSGVVKNWKQPIAYYMLANYTTVDILVCLIKEVLEKCFDVGLNIVATVCKLTPVNIKSLEILGSTKEKPFFHYKQYEIVTILDPPHLLKCFRDLFMEYDVLYSTDLQNRGIPILGTAKWSHIQTFYEKDKMNSNFVYAPALTDIHIYPNKKQKMRVKHAAQIFSHSVAAGIMAKTYSHELPAEAVTTANFLNRMDELFDALNANSKDLRRGKKYSLYLTKKSPHLENLRKMKILISELRFLGLDRNPSCQQGWIRTINAVEKLWHNLYRLGIRSLATRRLNLDVLENCFACIRYSCGSNFNPTVSQFVAGIKTAVITNLKYSGRHKNCEDDTLVIANNLRAFLVSGDIENTSNILGSCQYNP